MWGILMPRDRGVVAESSDGVVVMLKGDAIEQEPTAQLFASPREPYTRALLAAVPLHPFATPDETAGVVTFPAAEQAAYVTGAVIPVDGGAGMGH